MNIPQDPNATGPPRPTGGTLTAIADIREIFGLARTAAYDLAHHPDFPGYVPVPSRCVRWWASELSASAEAPHREHAQPRPRPKPLRAWLSGASRNRPQHRNPSRKGKN